MNRNLAQNTYDKDYSKISGFKTKNKPDIHFYSNSSTTLLIDNFIKPFTLTLLNQALKDKNLN